ncbi:hypothetical protein OfM1_19070 [Lactovum odontotermitis]
MKTKGIMLICNLCKGRFDELTVLNYPKKIYPWPFSRELCTECLDKEIKGIEALDD